MNKVRKIGCRGCTFVRELNFPPEGEVFFKKGGVLYGLPIVSGEEHPDAMGWIFGGELQLPSGGSVKVHSFYDNGKTRFYVSFQKKDLKEVFNHFRYFR